MADTQLTPSSARASSTYSTFTPAKAIDGDTGTNWSATGNNRHWLEVDLGSVQAFSKVRFYQGAAGEEYEVWTSPDGFMWDKVADSTAVADDDWTEFRFHPVEARYVLMRHSVGNDWGNAAEVEVWMEDAYTAFTGGTRVRRYLAGSDFTAGSTGGASASSTYSAADVDEPPHLQGYNEGGTADKWLSNGVAEGEWWKWDLGQAVPISRILVYSDNNSTVDFTPEVSTDDSAWDAFDTARVGVSTLTTPITFTDTEVSVRYVRITGGNVSGGAWMSISGVFVETDADIVEYGASAPPAAGTWALPDGSTWETFGRLRRRVTSTADEYGTAKYGGATYGGYSTRDSEEVDAYLMEVVTRTGKNYFRDAPRAGTARVRLANEDGRFSDIANHYSAPGDWGEFHMVTDFGSGPDLRWVFAGTIDSAKSVMLPIGREVVDLVLFDPFLELAAIDTPAFRDLGDGDTTYQRMQRLRSASSATNIATFGFGHNIIDPGTGGGPVGEWEDPTMLPTDLGGNRLTEMKQTMVLEGGELYINPEASQLSGGRRKVRLEFLGREWYSTRTRSTTTQATFGGTGVGITDAVVSLEAARVVNEATVTNDGGTPQTYADETPALRAQYGPRTLNLAGLRGDTDADALTLATFLVNSRKDAGSAPAVRSVVMPVVDADSLEVASLLELYDLVAYDVDALGAWDITGYSHVVGISHRIRQGGDWEVVYTLDDTYASAP